MNDESVQLRYSTRAAAYYRLHLKSDSEDIPFNESKPEYAVGREQIPADEVKAAESQVTGEATADAHKAANDGSLLGAASSYFSHAQENVTWAKAMV